MRNVSRIALLGLLAALPAAAVDEAQARRYALERLVVRNLAPAAAPYQQELEFEVRRFLDFVDRNGRPAPAYYEVGITNSWILHGYPGETVYVLSEAMPYLSPALRERARNFLSALVRGADPTLVGFEHCGSGWGSCELPQPRREFYLLPSSPNPDPLRPNLWPPPQVPAEAIYMVWRYADVTGDWDFISTARPPSGERWNRLRNLFQAIPATPVRYGEIAGAIGWMRLLEQFGLTSDPSYAAALSKVRAGLAAGADFSRFLDASYQRYIERQHDWVFAPFHFVRSQNAVGIFFAPEIGRFLGENSLESVRRRVTLNPREGLAGEPRSIENHWPNWFLYRGEYPRIELWTGHYGENHMVTPDTPWALFMVHAYIYNEPGEVLSGYLDVPYVLGDLCHWQRLVAAIQSFGAKSWEPLAGGPPPVNQPPLVSLAAPAAGSVYVAPASVTMRATASDPDGTVARVEFLVNGAVASTVAAAPYEATVTLSAAGSYALAARAVDNLGAAATSPSITVTVTAAADTTPPSVPQGLTAAVQSGASVRLQWQASTDNVGLAGYELERNAAVLAGLVTATQYTDTGLTAGSAYNYRVRAVDGAGNRSAWSAAVAVTVPPGGGAPPPSVPNLLANGGLETGDFTGWSMDWGLAVSPTAAHSGQYGMKMNGDGSVTQVVNTVVGRRYYVMARIRIDRELARSTWGGLRLNVTAWNWTELAAGFLTPADSPIGQWKRVDLTFVATSAQSRLQFANFSGGGRYEASADEFVLSEQPVPADGVTPPPANQPPVVSLTAPAAGTAYTAPASVLMRAAASDADGTVARVEFLVNGAVAGADTAAPYEFTATLSNAGNYALAARALDNQGALATSAAVAITVNAPSGGGGGGGGGGAPPSSNLLTNGGFETGNLNGWSGGGQATREDARGGGWSARLTTDSLSQVVNTTPGQSYKLTGWVRIASQSGSDWGGFRLEALSYDWKTLAHSGYLTLDSAGNTWAKYALSFTATTTQTRISVGFFGGSGLRMVAYADDLAVFARDGGGLPPELNPVLEVSEAPGGGATLAWRVEGDDPDGAVVRVNWDFGDGARALSFAGSRRAGLPGAHTAVFLASDDDGNVVTRTLNWTVPLPPGAPAISISTPGDGITVNSATLSVTGTASGAVARILVATDRETMAEASGGAAWSATLALRPGWNRILAQVRDSQGRIASAERRVRYVPSGALSISGFTESAAREQWTPVEIRFRVNNSAATHPQFPYDPRPPRGVQWVDGVSVDAEFSRDNWVTVLRRPAFLQQVYQRQLRDNQEWMYPNGGPVWTVRFSPPAPGEWRYRIRVREARGTAQSAERTLSVNPASAGNRGPVRVSLTDTRYFEYANGEVFLGGGSGIGAHTHRYSYDLLERLQQVGAGNQQMFRFWISGQIWGSAWSPWASRTLSYEGTVPPTGLSVESAYASGLAALRLDERNPLMFHGFSTSNASLMAGRRYRVTVRWRTEGVTGPRLGGQPFGVCMKFTGWPEPGQTGSLPALLPHVAGDTPWHVAYADFTADGYLLPNLALILENTTGGRAFVDEVGLHEILSNGSLGPQLLSGAKFNAHTTFDLRRSAALDAVFSQAQSLGITLRLVISEKQEYLLNHLGGDGLADRNPGNFNNGPGTPNWWLHEAYWRYLFARFGAFRSVHGWELVNEEAPGPAPHFRLAAQLAIRAGEDGNPHPATTSTWATFAEEAWKAPFSAPISNVDFHVYSRAGWIEPREELTNDTARFFAEYDLASLAMRWGKPATWGEQGLNAPGGTDGEEPGLARDRQGVWLHKMIWARTGPGGVYPLYWYTDNIFNFRLHPLYGNWNRFMSGVPLNNGRYVDAAARVSHADLRAWGQKDTVAGRAHLWIDNRRHTWRAVVDGAATPPVSGTVTLSMGTPNAQYNVTWHNTATGQPASTQTVSANAAGEVALSVSQLLGDTAVRLERR